MKIERLAPMRPASIPNRKEHGIPDELDQKDGPNQRTLADPDLRPVCGRHPDDRPDPVVVDQEREQHQEGLAIAPELAKRLAQASEGGCHRIGGGLLVRLQCRRRFPHSAEQR